MTADSVACLQMAGAWRELPGPHRRWIVTRALLATAAINVIVNAAIAWLSVQGQTAFAVALGALVTPLIALFSMADPIPDHW